MRLRAIICAGCFGMMAGTLVPAHGQDVTTPDSASADRDAPLQVTRPEIIIHGSQAPDVTDHLSETDAETRVSSDPEVSDTTSTTRAITRISPPEKSDEDSPVTVRDSAGKPATVTIGTGVEAQDRPSARETYQGGTPIITYDRNSSLTGNTVAGAPVKQRQVQSPPAESADPSVEPKGPVDEHLPAEAEGPLLIPVPAPEHAASTEHVDVIVEGERLSVRRMRTELHGVLIEASPIFTHLRGKVEIEDAILSYRRHQDGAELSIDFTTGEVFAGDVALGTLPDFQPRDMASEWLDTNAVSILTGTIVGQNEEGLTTFDLDKRLRPQFDLDLWVEGELQDTFGQEPRSIGPVLLLPLEVVVDALGHALEVEGAMISVTRVQDAVTLSLDLGSGLVSVNGEPRGITPDISFADGSLLLLPSSAVETLTGTHVTLEPGSSRVDVNLDDRLNGGVLPGDLVSDVINQSGLGIDSLEFQLGNRGPQRLALNGNYKTLTGRLQYDSIGSFESAAALQPGAIALDINSGTKWQATLGDHTPRLREVAGVGGSRLRGASWRTRKPSGAVLAIAAGLALESFEPVTERASRPTFDGFVGGGRYLAADRGTEVALATRIDDNTAQVIASAQTVLGRKERGLGLQDVFLAGDVGVFTGSPGRPVDVRGRATTRYLLSDRVGLNATVSYDGPRFAGGGGFGDTGSGVTAGARSLANLGVDFRSGRRFGPFDQLAGGLNTSVSHNGGDQSSTSVSVSGSTNARVSKLDLNVASSLSFSRASAGGVSQSARRFDLRLLRRFNWGEVQANYVQDRDGEGVSTNTLVANVGFETWRRPLGKGAELNFGPTLSGLLADGARSVNAGARLGIQSGEAFGSRFRVGGQVSALQAVNANDTSQTFFSSLQASYRIFRNTSLDLNYFDNLRGQRSVTIGLRGRIPLGSRAPVIRPKEGRGLLQGRVFLDLNRDGIRQDNEPGLAGAVVSLKNTNVSLRADQAGNFTIVNLPAGLFEVDIQTRFLPLGLLVAEDAVTRGTIGPDRVTRLDIPVIASGQIRGTVFIDENFNGAVDPGEQRLEGKTIKLVAVDGLTEPIFLPAVSFGQFSFEGITPGEYRLEVEVGGTTHSSDVSVSEETLQQRVFFAVPPDGAHDSVPVETLIISDLE